MLIARDLSVCSMQCITLLFTFLRCMALQRANGNVTQLTGNVFHRVHTDNTETAVVTPGPRGSTPVKQPDAHDDCTLCQLEKCRHPLLHVIRSVLGS